MCVCVHVLCCLYCVMCAFVDVVCDVCICGCCVHVILGCTQLYYEGGVCRHWVRP